MLGRDESDPLFLQVKEADKSVLSRFVGASKYANMGQRVVAGQRLMQHPATSSWAGSGSRQGWTASSAILCPPAAGLETLHRHRGPDTARYADLRRGLRVGAGPGARLLGDRIAIAAYLGGSDVSTRPSPGSRRLRRPEQRDHESLVDAVASGRITAEPDM